MNSVHGASGRKTLRAALRLLPRFRGVPFLSALLFREIAFQLRRIVIRLFGKFRLEFRDELLGVHGGLHAFGQLLQKAMNHIFNARPNTMLLRVVEVAQLRAHQLLNCQNLRTQKYQRMRQCKRDFTLADEFASQPLKLRSADRVRDPQTLDPFAI
jgi:hypothetical protein